MSRRQWRRVGESTGTSWRAVEADQCSANHDRETTHRQQYIAKVHQDHDYAANSGKVCPITPNNEKNGDTVMRVHLPVILAPFFDIDDKELVAPETELGEIVEFCEAGKRCVGVVSP